MRVDPDGGTDDRDLIRAIDEHLHLTSGVVVDDVVLRTWGNGQPELTYLLLDAAIAASGGAAPERELWAVARAVALGEGLVPPAARPAPTAG